MRVILDTNIFISYLLTPLGKSTINTLVDAALTGVFRLLIASDILGELQRKVAVKPHLVQRIAPDDVGELVSALLEVAETIPAIEEAIPEIGRDRKDDYLIAYALVGQADYLVSGDDDLLSLGEVEGLKIVSPREFVALLEQNLETNGR